MNEEIKKIYEKHLNEYNSNPSSVISVTLENAINDVLAIKEDLKEEITFDDFLGPEDSFNTVTEEYYWFVYDGALFCTFDFDDDNALEIFNADGDTILNPVSFEDDGGEVCPVINLSKALKYYANLRGDDDE